MHCTAGSLSEHPTFAPRTHDLRSGTHLRSRERSCQFGRQRSRSGTVALLRIYTSADPRFRAIDYENIVIQDAMSNNECAALKFNDTALDDEFISPS